MEIYQSRGGVDEAVGPHQHSDHPTLEVGQRSGAQGSNRVTGERRALQIDLQVHPVATERPEELEVNSVPTHHALDLPLAQRGAVCPKHRVLSHRSFEREQQRTGMRHAAKSTHHISKKIGKIIVKFRLIR